MSEQGGEGNMGQQGGGGRRGRRGRDGRSVRPATSLEKMFDKDAPHAIEAEKALLGSMILEPKVIPDIIGLVQGRQDFYREAHGHIFHALLDIYDRHDAGDLIQTTTLLRDRAVLDSVGGEGYLLELANSVPTAVNAPHFARIWA